MNIIIVMRNVINDDFSFNIIFIPNVFQMHAQTPSCTGNSLFLT